MQEVMADADWQINISFNVDVHDHIVKTHENLHGKSQVYTSDAVSTNVTSSEIQTFH